MVLNKLHRPWKKKSSTGWEVPSQTPSYFPSQTTLSSEASHSRSGSGPGLLPEWQSYNSPWSADTISQARPPTQPSPVINVSPPYPASPMPHATVPRTVQELDAPEKTRVVAQVMTGNQYVIHSEPPPVRRISEDMRGLNLQDIEKERLSMERAKQDSERRQRAEVEKRKSEREQNASVERVRHLRGLIREKYRLDLYVWSEREIQEADREDIKPEYVRADQILQEIYWIVNAWEEDQFDPEEWKLVKKIKDGLNKGPDQHLLWNDLPPWDERRLNRQYLENDRTSR